MATLGEIVKKRCLNLTLGNERKRSKNEGVWKEKRQIRVVRVNHSGR